jgi:hypothetical protein
VDASEGWAYELLSGDDLMFTNTEVSPFSIRIEVRTFRLDPCRIRWGTNPDLYLYVVAGVQDAEWADKGLPINRVRHHAPPKSPTISVLAYGHTPSRRFPVTVVINVASCRHY